jgi:endonuclease/exonuclease/phosphatase family metal-dependent hydrolase
MLFHMIKKFFFVFLVYCSGLMVMCDSSSDPDKVKEAPDESKVVASVKVMTYNIHHCNPPSRPGLIDVPAVVKVIRAANPDVVALQEVDVNTMRSGLIDQASAIAAELGMYHYFGKAIDYDGGAYGVAILSKYRLYNTVVYRLPMVSAAENRVMAMASLKLPDSTAIRFVSTHLDAQGDPANRLSQIARIIDIAADETLPVIIGGDFNAVPGSEEINLLDTHFDRTCRLCPPTIPVTDPTRAIDFIAYRHPENRFDVSSHKVIDAVYASDHRPVSAVIDVIE